MILRRRLWTLSVIYLALVSLAIWYGGHLLSWHHGARIVGIAMALSACGGLILLTEACFVRPLRRRLLRLSDLIRTMDPMPPPPRLRGRDELEEIRADLRRMMHRLDETRGDQAARRVRAEVDSRTDPLTKLYNHRSFARLILEEWESALRARAPLALLILDVDYFKSVNDELGHLAGNQALERIAGLIRESVRPTDLVFRYAGDEFAIILPRTGLEQAANLAEKIRLRVNGQRIEGPGGNDRQLSLTIGASEMRPEMRSPEELLSLADRALYQGKEAGRNVVACAMGRAGFKLYPLDREEQ